MENQVLFQNKDIYVTFDMIEIEGQAHSPLHLKQVTLRKHGTEIKHLVYGVLFILGGMYALLGLKWTVVGWIATVIGGLYILINLPAVRSGRVTTSVILAFRPTHTGDVSWKSLLVNDYKEALKLEEVLKGVAGLT
jgi:hypothetical protein